ncbi:NADP-dependent malic enzyme, partial [Haemophilus influenzae]
PLTNIQHVAI